MKYKRLHLLFLATMTFFGYPMIAGYLDAGMLSVLIVLVAPFVHAYFMDIQLDKHLNSDEL